MIVLLTGSHATDKKYIENELYEQLNYKKIIYKDYDISYDLSIEEQNSKDIIVIKNKEGQIIYKLTGDSDDKDINFIPSDDLVKINSLISERKEYLFSKNFLHQYFRSEKTQFDTVNFWKKFIQNDDEEKKLELLTSSFTVFNPNYFWSYGFKDYPGKGDIMLDIIHERHQKRMMKYLSNSYLLKEGDEIFINANLRLGSQLFVRAISKYHEENPDLIQVFNLSISENLINMLIRSVGKENIFVINLTRNPSSSYLFDFDIEEDEKDTNSSTDKIFTDKTFHYKLTGKSIYSLFNQCVLKENSKVLTIKYEELLKNPSIEILGKKIIFPKIKTTNNLITEYEYKKILPILRTKKYFEKVSLLPLYNKMFSNVHQNLNKNFFNEKAKNYFYNNVFQELNYRPLSFFDICSTRKH